MRKSRLARAEIAPDSDIFERPLLKEPTDAVQAVVRNLGTGHEDRPPVAP